MGWGFNATLCFTPGKDPVSLYRRLGGPPGRAGRVRRISPLTGIRSPDRPACSASLSVKRKSTSSAGNRTTIPRLSGTYHSHYSDWAMTVLPVIGWTTFISLTLSAVACLFLCLHHATFVAENRTLFTNDFKRLQIRPLISTNYNLHSTVCP